MHNATKYGAILAVLAVFALPAEGAAQSTGRLSVEGRGGVGVPAGNLWTLTDVGPTAGASLIWNFHPNWALRADFDWARLDDGQDSLGVTLSPPVNMLFYGGSVEANFGQPRYQDLPLKFMANLGAGAVKMDVDETFDPAHAANLFDHTYLALQGGAKIGYQVAPWINIFANGTAYFLFLDSADTIVFLNPESLPEVFDTGWLFPFTLGVRLTFLR